LIAKNERSLRARAQEHYIDVARLGRVFSSPVRLRILNLLRQAPRTVEDIAEAAGIAEANASQHLQQMRAVHVVVAERRGQYVQYRIVGESVSTLFGMLRELAEQLLPELSMLREDLHALEPDEREQLLARIRRGEVTLLDVRPGAEFRAGHLPGARSIPLHELASRIDELPREREVVAYCRGPYCPMALEAVSLLERAGYAARHLDLGVPDLRDRGFPVVTQETEHE
jgi:rhodanese-related sulfurtransferase